MPRPRWIAPELDPEFRPAVRWSREFREELARSRSRRPVVITLERPDGSGSRLEAELLPLTPETWERNLRTLERLVKFLLWQRGASRILISGCDPLTQEVADRYSRQGDRSFDQAFFHQVYGAPLEILALPEDEHPRVSEEAKALGGNLDGCRIGFDLGGSDRKAAALIDGEVVFSEEIPWSPYFESDPEYHLQGIRDSLLRAAAHLPRVDAIGGSAAGVYVDNEVRAASLFRGIPDDLFQTRIRRLFLELKAEWGGIPFEVVNDGEVTALAGSMSLGIPGVLGLSLGTSLAAGYVTPEGRITPWLDELAFAPLDYRADAPVDEWSGDAGCGVQYLSQQALGRLTRAAGLDLPEELSLPEKLVALQERMELADPRAERIYSTLGTYLGYAVAHYAEFYRISRVLLLGRVTSGPGGTLLALRGQEILEEVFPDLGEQIEIVTLDERGKRHGQAVAAASLPRLG